MFTQFPDNTVNPYNHYNFKNEMCLTYMCKLQYWQEGANDRAYRIHAWLEEHIGPANYIFGFEDYGQHGEWMLYTRTEADLLAFKIVHSNMSNI